MCPPGSSTSIEATGMCIPLPVQGLPIFLPYIPHYRKYGYFMIHQAALLLPRIISASTHMLHVNCALFDLTGHRPNQSNQCPGRALHCQVENHVQRKKIYIYIKDHQNKSIFFHFLFTSRYTQYLLHSKNCNQIRIFCFYIKHTVSN